ncbi:MAG: iron-containing redox enzyme family protein [Rudaea sp.]|uniref:TenA family transcriptional regulator n=1 Tax=unclassified Rudaea TaxID=2627037 RepID=UPI0010F477E1|nr:MULTISPECIES: iron-containing redox enzyme family protein [unclassified Rudaea]MBN8884810.1 iron-containing redox enzyme family protein [Rudaea sp.]MBR0347109.1 iron-containing redox enzyme family protein [Rudaea sp.]
MNIRFERSGPIDRLSSYPSWAQDMVGACEGAKREVVRHELFAMMRETRLSIESTTNFMVGIWPVIERFPGYMAASLMKTRYGRSEGDNMARRWLVRNIRVEQNHAEYWLDWAEGAGVAREKVLNDWVPADAMALANWCEEVSTHDTLAAGIAATNYAVEGATGEWSQLVYDSETYRRSMPNTPSLRWLKLHAAYDDEHPWEALEIVCTLIGTNPVTHQVGHLRECIRRSYAGMRILADRCIAASRFVVDVPSEAAA